MTTFSAPPYNNRFNLLQRGRHAFCSGGSKGSVSSAKVAPEPPFVCPFQARRMGATASQVNRALYGRENQPCDTEEKVNVEPGEKSCDKRSLPKCGDKVPGPTSFTML